MGEHDDSLQPGLPKCGAKGVTPGRRISFGWGSLHMS